MSKRAPKMDTASQMVRMARNVSKLENEKRELTARLKEVTQTLRFEKRALKALAQQAAEHDPHTPPMRLFGESQRDK